jgi:hypothetical protein
VRPRALPGRYPAAVRLASRLEAIRAQAVLGGGGEALASGGVDLAVRAPARAVVHATAEGPPAGGAADRPHGITVLVAGSQEAGARLMLHVSTQDGYGTRELITPRGIARGGGDRLAVLRRDVEHQPRSGLLASASPR